MRVIYLFQNLNRFLQICLTDANTCHLSNATRTEWRLAAANDVDFEVSFVTELLNDKGYSANSLMVQISHLALYADLKTPNKFHELLAFVISVMQDMKGSQFSFQENLQIAKNVFQDLKIDESDYRLVGMPVLLNLSQLKVFDGISNHLIVSLEDEKKTINLSEVITQVLPCGTLSQWSFTQWSSVVISNKAYFYGNALATCEGKSIEKKMIINVVLDSELLIDENKITVSFYVN